MKILCFSPHPDDEILGCGGSIAKSLSFGHEVYICYLSFGEYGSSKISPEKLSIIRKKEIIDVVNYLKIPQTNISFLSIPDNQIDSKDIDIVKKIITLTRTIKPDLVYLPHIREQSPDHEETHKLVMRSLDMAGSNNFSDCGGSAWWVDNVLAYEVWTPMERYQYSEDVSNFISYKINALKLYKSQTNEEGNVSDFIGEKSKYLSGYRAAMTIGEYREMFQVIRIGGLFDKNGI